MRDRIWNAIAKRCDDNDITMYRLSQLADVNDRLIYRCGKDGAYPHLETLAAMANAVGLEVNVTLTPIKGWELPPNVS